MKEFRILEINELYQPQISIELYKDIWFFKTKNEWFPISKNGEKWFDTYEDALNVIKEYKKTEKKYHYID